MWSIGRDHESFFLKAFMAGAYPNNEQCARMPLILTITELNGSTKQNGGALNAAVFPFDRSAVTTI
jgi:hypothetical protein